MGAVWNISWQAGGSGRLVQRLGQEIQLRLIRRTMMENDIVMMTVSFISFRVLILAAAGYVVYRVLRGEPTRQRVRVNVEAPIERRRGAYRLR